MRRTESTDGAPTGPDRNLTADEERVLIRLIDHSRHPGAPLENGARCKHASLETIAAVHSVSLEQAEEIVHNARRARELILQYHWRLVHYVARKYKSQYSSHEDLFAEGMQGLPVALDKFDPSHNVRFGTYAFHQCKAFIMTAVAGATSVLLPSQHDYRQLVRVRDAQAVLVKQRDERGFEIYNSWGAVPVSKIAAQAGMSTSLVARVLKSAKLEVSLDAPTKLPGGGGNHEFVETLADTLMAEPEDGDEAHGNGDRMFNEADTAIIRGSFATVLQTLNPRERNCLRLRYGLNKEGVVVSRKRIAEAYGVSLEQVWKIEEAALRKLGAPWRRQYLAKACGGVLHKYPNVVPKPSTTTPDWSVLRRRQRKS